MNSIESKIILHELELPVFLGWSEAERLRKQMVMLDITLHFKTPPLACQTDQLKDTVCYQFLADKIKDHLETRKFHLLEHLGFDVYTLIKTIFPADTRVQISISKQPPIPNLKKAIFSYGDA